MRDLLVVLRKGSLSLFFFLIQVCECMSISWGHTHRVWGDLDSRWEVDGF